MSDAHELKIAVRELRKYLHWGEAGRIALQFGITKSRSTDLLRGKIRATDADMPFIMALYDKALPRKAEHDKLKQLSR